VDDLRESLAQAGNDERYARIHTDAEELRRLMQESQQMLSQRLAELEILDRRSTGLTQRLYDQALACRMRPFMDGLHRFPRLVRDLGQALGKRIRLEIVGASTQIDRDILEKLDGPLNHLLNNAIDHGIEPPEERAALGKPPEAVITLAAHHKAGMLQLTVSDDGRGIDLETLRSMIVKRQLSTDDMAGKLSERELLEFLFLPGFTMKESVTELSGRGVGLDVVLTMIKQVRGVITASSRPGKGMQFQLQLPLTLSVIDTLVVTVRDELYAFPLAHILATVKVKKEEVTLIEGRQHFHFKGRQIGLATSHQILEGKDAEIDADDLCIVVAGEQEGIYGLIVDGFVGQRELVLQTLDPRLGKIRNISAAALMDDGAPVLILDVDDMLRSLEKITATGRLNTVRTGAHEDRKPSKRVLIVDDSLTVRELERKLLTQHGYEVEVAVDGIDGWNAVRAANFDLVITDIDMPRLDGIGLLKLIRQNPNLKSRPVMIVSYKDREEDRQRGLEAGADYYLTKGSFHDETMLQAVVDLIGEASG
jgi:two-component system sensor histidine kinase and response regulator WspE